MKRLLLLSMLASLAFSQNPPDAAAREQLKKAVQEYMKKLKIEKQPTDDGIMRPRDPSDLRKLLKDPKPANVCAPETHVIPIDNARDVTLCPVE